MFLLHQVHILLESRCNITLSVLFTQLCQKIRTLFGSKKRIRPYLVLSSVDVVVLPFTVMDGAVLFLTPLRVEDCVVILRETFALGSDWSPNPILLQTLTDLAGPPRLLLGLICQACGRQVDLFMMVDIDMVRAKLLEYCNSATGQGYVHDAHKSARDTARSRARCA
jgi:hypothetical protein